MNRRGFLQRIGVGAAIVATPAALAATTEDPIVLPPEMTPDELMAFVERMGTGATLEDAGAICDYAEHLQANGSTDAAVYLVLCALRADRRIGASAPFIRLTPGPIGDYVCRSRIRMSNLFDKYDHRGER